MWYVINVLSSVSSIRSRHMSYEMAVKSIEAEYDIVGYSRILTNSTRFVVTHGNCGLFMVFDIVCDDDYIEEVRQLC